jgi:inosine-uridine nucleoside N-ribohydrolase
LVLTLAIPYGPWRTGRLELEPLAPMQAPAAQPTRRIWVDTDAACGHAPRTDPDDCLALLALAQQVPQRIAGISVVAGNAPLDVTDRTTRELMQLANPGIAVHSGHRALAHALEAEPLTIVALGPLTNIASALRDRPRLAAKVAQLVAVMGRRPGHLFHPAEGAGGGMLLGHGPVFSDFNFAQDPAAAAAILGYDFPIILVPYDAARHVEIDGAGLDRLAARGGAHAWVAERSRGWLAFWQEDIGRAGFYPFDLLAALFVLAPQRFECAEVLAGVGRDRLFLLPWHERALLVTQQPEDLKAAAVKRPAVYCHKLRP